MNLLSALALISAEKSVRKQERREQFWASFWDGVFSASKNKTEHKSTFKFSKGTVVIIKVLLVLIGITLIYLRATRG